jgi:hypothetical protein
MMYIEKIPSIYIHELNGGTQPSDFTRIMPLTSLSSIRSIREALTILLQIMNHNVHTYSAADTYDHACEAIVLFYSLSLAATYIFALLPSDSSSKIRKPFALYFAKMLKKFKEDSQANDIDIPTYLHTDLDHHIILWMSNEPMIPMPNDNNDKVENLSTAMSTMHTTTESLSTVNLQEPPEPIPSSAPPKVPSSHVKTQEPEEPEFGLLPLPTYHPNINTTSDDEDSKPKARIKRSYSLDDHPTDKPSHHPPDDDDENHYPSHHISPFASYMTDSSSVATKRHHNTHDSDQDSCESTTKKSKTHSGNSGGGGSSGSTALTVSELWRTGLMGWLGPRSGSVIGT